MRKSNETLRLVPALHRATHGVGLYVQAAGLGVTQAEAHLLAQLAAEGPATIGALHAAFGHRRSTLTSILDRLAATGLVLREVHEHDRRSFLVSLTPRGRQLARKVLALLGDLEARVARRVRASDLAGFTAVVEALYTEAATQRRKR